MSDQKSLSMEEIERLRPQEGQTADEFYKLRVDNQPSKLQQDENESKPKAQKPKDDLDKPVEEDEKQEKAKPAAKKTAAKKTTASTKKK